MTLRGRADPGPTGDRPPRAMTRADRSRARRRAYYQGRIDSAETLVDTLNAGFAYLASVVRHLEEANPEKARQITQDTTEFLLRQANTHDRNTAGGKRGARRTAST